MRQKGLGGIVVPSRGKVHVPGGPLPGQAQRVVQVDGESDQVGFTRAGLEMHSG